MENKITTEDIRKEFKSQFELVNYAIRLAENMIKSGRESRVTSNKQNRAMQILEEIATGQDQLVEIYEEPEPIVVAPKEERTSSFAQEAREKKSARDSQMKTSSKKNRKVFTE
jgi:hypothetical protein